MEKKLFYVGSDKSASNDLVKEKEWKLLYVGSAESVSYDQVKTEMKVF
jgi:HKD family nuclease